MGRNTGVSTGGTRPPVRNSGGRTPEITFFREHFQNICQNFHILQHFQNKVGEIREEIEIWGYMVLTHLNPPPRV